MKHGQIAGNRRLNTLIYRCFEYICEEDEQKFVKRFREQPPTSDQIMHTVRELILGAYLCASDFIVRYDYVIDKQTPDWCILNEMSKVVGIVELANFHIDQTTEHEIEKKRQTGSMAIYWRDANRDNVARLYECIWKKAQAYRTLVHDLKLPYIIAVFADFRVAIDSEEIDLCLFDEKTGLFGLYPEISGVLYFEESSGRHLFRYTNNPNSPLTLDIPSGVFPPHR